MSPHEQRILSLPPALKTILSYEIRTSWIAAILRFFHTEFADQLAAIYCVWKAERKYHIWIVSLRESKTAADRAAFRHLDRRGR